ncbi:gamma-glutamyl-gamma-aminobutyrate hydrolase family protein [Paenisporosarcina indica]|uniref:gamma-glutamyl-gamma-aminobutyrate hydrolase family protein n=1 Tax=Paenisporosarcina indica TaxID=650093 RepID=UPI00094FED3C|nr:gamma-glutamyl-gamma-aminobutyrate hydrolase family protein [Paenisporosarcina indica]
MKPIIGVTSFTELNGTDYMITVDDANAVLQAGGLPVALPNLLDISDIDEIVQSIDGLYLTGGYDIDPTLFGEEPHPKLGNIVPSRDAFELMLIRKFLELDKPILGVCRGCQILNIAVGGDMYQDTGSQVDHDILQHRQLAPKTHGSHFVDVPKGTLLHQITGSERFKINSRHHQSNRYVPTPFRVSGTASDGVIEAIESEAHSFVLAVQWHPESMATGGDAPSLKIFEAFVGACRK